MNVEFRCSVARGRSGFSLVIRELGLSDSCAITLQHNIIHNGKVRVAMSRLKWKKIPLFWRYLGQYVLNNTSKPLHDFFSEMHISCELVACAIQLRLMYLCTQTTFK